MSNSYGRHPEFQSAAERERTATSSTAPGTNGAPLRLPRFLIIGAGQRGTAYATAIANHKLPGIIAAVAEPSVSRRTHFGRRFIWPEALQAREDQEFDTWQDFVKYERSRRDVASTGERVYPGVDGVFICTLDGTHREIIAALAPFKLHVMCEKPMAATLDDCRSIFTSLTGILEDKDGKTNGGRGQADVIFSIGHVLRYSPHNMLLRRLVLEERVIGDIVSIEHTEPVGWSHFAHSYVRGNWRRDDTTGPVLMSKSCHDIDFVLWLLCYRSGLGHGSENANSNSVDADGSSAATPSYAPAPPHMPSLVSSTGNLAYFTRRRKPKAAGTATNCLSCAHEKNCIWSAKRHYIDQKFDKGEYDWPCDVLVPDLEDIVRREGRSKGRQLLTDVLAQDFGSDKSMSDEEVKDRPWYGRCVWESDNNVLDDQVVTLQWDEDSLPTEQPQETQTNDHEDGNHNNLTLSPSDDRGPKTATLHMISPTERQCERRGWIYGTRGEISYDSYDIRVYDFESASFRQYKPSRPGGGHGGGDAGLAGQFVKAVRQVVNRRMSVPQAQAEFIGCDIEEAFMSHAMVYAAEEARTSRKVVEWKGWWERLLKGEHVPAAAAAGVHK